MLRGMIWHQCVEIKTVHKSIFSSVITSTACNDRRQITIRCFNPQTNHLYKEKRKTRQKEDERKTKSEGRKIRKDESVFLVCSD